MAKKVTWPKTRMTDPAKSGQQGNESRRDIVPVRRLQMNETMSRLGPGIMDGSRTILCRIERLFRVASKMRLTQRSMLDSIHCHGGFWKWFTEDADSFVLNAKLNRRTTGK